MFSGHHGKCVYLSHEQMKMIEILFFSDNFSTMLLILCLTIES